MKQVKIENKEYIFIEVPDDKERRRLGTFCKDSEVRWQLTHLMLKPFLNFYQSSRVIYNVQLSEAKEDKFEIITTTNNITEEIAKNVVEKWRMIQGEIGQGDANLFTNYLNLFSSSASAFTNNALESFYSLMDSLELDRNKNYLLIEKLKQ